MADETKIEIQVPAYEELKKQNIELTEKVTKLEGELKKKTDANLELDKQLTSEVECSKARKEKYDNLINYLSGKYGCAPDEEIIRGEVETIIKVEGKLDTANKIITNLQDQHKQEKEDILGQVETLKTQAEAHLTNFEAYTNKLNEIENKLLSMIQKEVKESSLTKLLDKTKKLLKIK
jgi:hypothetical protein